MKKIFKKVLVGLIILLCVGSLTTVKYKAFGSDVTNTAINKISENDFINTIITKVKGEEKEEPIFLDMFSEGHQSKMTDNKTNLLGGFVYTRLSMTKVVPSTETESGQEERTIISEGDSFSTKNIDIKYSKLDESYYWNLDNANQFFDGMLIITTTSVYDNWLSLDQNNMFEATDESIEQGTFEYNSIKYKYFYIENMADNKSEFCGTNTSTYCLYDSKNNVNYDLTNFVENCQIYKIIKLDGESSLNYNNGVIFK